VGGKRLRIVDASPATGTGRPGELSADGSVATGDGRILLGAVQPEGRNVMPAADWLRGANLGLPVVLGG
jgi:methionyl-tRNA formyltransferase